MIKEIDILNLLLKDAKRAAKRGEIPVSALIVKDNKIITHCYNRKERKNDVTAHAEVLAIKKAAKKLKRWNLNDCVLYTSLKPCNMCCEVIKQSRIEKVVYFLDKLNYKHDFDKTDFENISVKTFSDSYQQLLSLFFQNKRR